MPKAMLILLVRDHAEPGVIGEDHARRYTVAATLSGTGCLCSIASSVGQCGVGISSTRT